MKQNAKKTGRLIKQIVTYEYSTEICRCSECKCELKWGRRGDEYNYCPYCGVKIERGDAR